MIYGGPLLCLTSKLLVKCFKSNILYDVVHTLIYKIQSSGTPSHPELCRYKAKELIFHFGVNIWPFLEVLEVSLNF